MIRALNVRLLALVALGVAAAFAGIDASLADPIVVQQELVFEPW